MPDVNARAFRDGDGDGGAVCSARPEPAAARPPISITLSSTAAPRSTAPSTPNPANYDDRSFVTATWTDDGRHVSALVHHEYHADAHHVCRATGDLGLLVQFSILAYRSGDGGATFQQTAEARRRVRAIPPGCRTRAPPRLLQSRRTSLRTAATNTCSPRRRAGAGQPYGACLFRTADPADSSGLARVRRRRAFSIAYADPYRAAPAPAQKPCQIIAPFLRPRSAPWCACRRANGWRSFKPPVTRGCFPSTASIRRAHAI